MYQRSDLEAIAGMLKFGQGDDAQIERTVGNVFREHLTDLEARIGKDKLQTLLFRLFWIQRDSLKHMQKWCDYCIDADQEVTDAADVRKQAARDMKHSEQNSKNLLLRVAEMKDAFVSEKAEMDRKMDVLLAYKRENEARQTEIVQQLQLKDAELAKSKKEVKALKAELKKAKASREWLTRNAPPPQALAASASSRTLGMTTPRSGQNSNSNSTTNLQASGSLRSPRVKSSTKKPTEKYMNKLFDRLSNPHPTVISTPQIPKLRLSTASTSGPSRMSPRVPALENLNQNDIRLNMNDSNSPLIGND